jgi:hypothetical protein
VTPPRLKSSFIYLANAVNDLRANWITLAIALAPLVLLTSICLLPSALNLQHAVAEHFAPGTRHVGWMLMQEPYAPAAEETRPLFGWWVLMILGFLALALTAIGFLVVLCSIRRIISGVAITDRAGEALATWRETISLAPAFFWIVLLQFAPPIVAWLISHIYIFGSIWWLAVAFYILQTVFLTLGALWFLWLYFAAYALAFDHQHGLHALLFSRDLMRKRFFRVAMRIVVFLAVWSGYYSWTGFAFVVMSWILGPVGLATGYFWSFFFVVEFISVAVTFVMIAFFVTAGHRLYRDLVELVRQEVPSTTHSVAVSPTAPIPAANG